MTKSKAIRLRKYTTVMVLVAVALAATFATIRLPTPVVDQMLSRDIQQQAQIWRKRLVGQLDNHQNSFLFGRLTADDLAYLSTITQTSDLYRLKLFTPEGRVFWSSRPGDIGSVNTKDYFSEVILNGDDHYIHAPKDASEIDDFELHSNGNDSALLREVAEIYVPIIKDGSVVGAIEFYTDITNLRNVFIRRVTVVFALASVIGLALMGGIVISITRASARQMQILQDKSREQSDGMEKQMRLAREVRLLGELNEWLQSSHSLDELFDMVAQFMTHMLPESEGSIYVYSNSRDVLDGSASWNGGAHRDHIHPEACWGLRRGRTYVYGDSEVNFVCEHTEPHDDRAYFCFPILAHGETVGLMHLKKRKGVPDETFHASRKLAHMCAEQISMAIANVRMRDQLHDQSVRDPLTGLFNRRHMTESLRKLIVRAQKDRTPLNLISVDVDHFKKFNDNHGHDAGDMVLRAVGGVLERACDGDEVACRMGGEEFMLLWPDADMAEVVERAETLRRDVEGVSVRYGEKALPRITISVGVARFPDHGQIPQDLMRVADDALYDAKAQGRNQVAVASFAAAEAPGLPGPDAKEPDGSAAQASKPTPPAQGSFAAE